MGCQLWAAEFKQFRGPSVCPGELVFSCLLGIHCLNMCCMLLLYVTRQTYQHVPDLVAHDDACSTVDSLPG